MPNDPTDEAADQRPALSGSGGGPALGRRGFLTLASGAALAAAPVVALTASTASADTASPDKQETAAKPAVAPPPPATPAAGDPDFGPNVYVFDSNSSTESIQSTIDAV